MRGGEEQRKGQLQRERKTTGALGHHPGRGRKTVLS